LNLVDNDLGFSRISFDQLNQSLRACRQLAEGLRLKEVNTQGLGVLMGRPKGLAGAAEGPAGKNARGWGEEFAV
jgi:hypothetical protein